MEAGLNELFERNGAPGARLLSAKLIEKEKKLLATVEVGSLLTMGRMAAIQRGLCEAMGCATQVDYCFCGPAESLLAGRDEALLTALCQSFMELWPTARPALACSRWRFEGEGEAVIAVAPELLDLAAEPRALRAAADFYKRAYGLNLRLRVEADASIEAPAPAREAEAEGQAAQMTKKSGPASKKKAAAADRAGVLYGKTIKRNAMIRQSEVKEDSGRVVIGGALTNLDLRPTKTGAHILTFAISDNSNTLPCKMFLREGGQKLADDINAAAKKGEWLLVSGDYNMDEFLHRMCVHVRDIGSFSVPKREHGWPYQRKGGHRHGCPLGP